MGVELKTCCCKRCHCKCPSECACQKGSWCLRGCQAANALGFLGKELDGMTVGSKYEVYP